jgi:DNA polymerase-3 subunit gamma/tau
MSEHYQVLARKYRPHKFEEMVGQAHTIKTLVNALDSNNLHHGFLFTGTRGVGKTTIARIFAKSVNCETGVSSKPLILASIICEKFLKMLNIYQQRISIKSIS